MSTAKKPPPSRRVKMRSSGHAISPRLRFDKVVMRLAEQLKSGLADTIPGGTTVMVTVTAPIRLASKTAAAIEEIVTALVEKRSSSRDRVETIHGNRVCLRVVRGESPRAPRLLAFVHNPDQGPRPLLDRARDLLAILEDGAGAKTGRSSAELVVVSADDRSWLPAYRAICSELRMPTGPQKILVAFADGNVEVLF